MFVFTKKGVLSPLQSISLLAIFFTSMGVATVSPAMAKLAAQFPSNNYALISTLPTLFIVPTTLWAGAVAGKKIRYRTISLVGILLFLIGGIAPFFLTESFTVLLICRAVFGIGVGLRASLGNALVMQYYTGKEQADMLGYGNLISNFGGVLLQMVAGSLAEYGWNYTFLAHLLGLFSLLLLVFQPEPEESCCAPTVTAEVPNGYRHSLLKSAGFDHRGRIATALTAFLLFLQQLVSYPILMNISLLFEHRHAGGATVAATALSLYSASGCLIGILYCRCRCWYIRLCKTDGNSNDWICYNGNDLRFVDHISLCHIGNVYFAQPIFSCDRNCNRCKQFRRVCIGLLFKYAGNYNGGKAVYTDLCPNGGIYTVGYCLYGV